MTVPRELVAANKKVTLAADVFFVDGTAFLLALVFNLVQSLKTLFLYTQSEQDTVEEYARNFQSLWDTVEAFGGSSGIHQGLVDTDSRERGSLTPTTISWRRHKMWQSSR